MCNRMQRFHNLSVIGMILIIAYRMGNRQVITKVPAGMLRGLSLQCINAPYSHRSISINDSIKSRDFHSFTYIAGRIEYKWDAALVYPEPPLTPTT